MSGSFRSIAQTLALASLLSTAAAGCIEDAIEDENLGSTAQFARTVSVYPGADTSIIAGAPNNGNGAGAGLFVGRSGPLAAVGPSSAHRSLIWFSTNGFGNSTASRLILNFNVTGTASSGAVDSYLYLYQLTQGFNEGVEAGNHAGSACTGGATWNGYNCYNGWTAGGAYSTFTGRTAGFMGLNGSAFNFDSTFSYTICAFGCFTYYNSAMVTQWNGWVTTPSTNYGWLLYGDESSDKSLHRLGSRTSATPPRLDITFDCNTGYYDTGATPPSALCSVDGNWCANPGNGSNAPLWYYSGGLWSGTPSYNANAYYYCNTGYQQGSATMYATCQANRTWTAIPYCNATTTYCAAAVPTVTNATYAVSGGVAGGSTQSYNATATYACNAGYVSNSGSNSVCQSNQTWSTPTFACSVNNTLCPAPGAVSNATAVLSGGLGGNGTRSMNSTLSYTCNTGYTGSGAVSATCQSNGTWSTAATITCTPTVPYCVAPPDIANDTGVVTYTGGTSPGNNSYLASANYSCSTGYASNLGTLPVCQAAGSWSSYTVACGAVTTYCAAAPPSVANATFTIAGGVAGGSTQSYNATATYTCGAGYVGNGGSNSTCQSNQTWSTPTYACSVNNTLCAAPSSITNASFTLSGGLGGNGTRSLGSTLSYTCNNGYTGSGAVNATCTASGWSTAATITCTPTVPYCSSAPDIANDTGVISFTGGTQSGSNSLGATANYTCSTGYAGSGTLPTCLSGGSWSAFTYACTLVNPFCAAAPPSVTNATYAISGGIGGGSTSTYNAVATYSCGTGYTGNGGSNATCQSNQLWSTPTFACSSNNSFCGTPPTVTNASVVLLGGVGGNGTQSYGATADYTCNVGYTGNGGSDATCLASASWSAPTLACTAVNCGAAPTVTNAGVPTVSGGVAGGTTYQATAAYICNSGYQKVGGDPTCQASGTWSAAPLCNDVNECASGSVCGVGACSNLPGTYSCSCPAGYTFRNGTCEITDACVAISPCDTNATCTPVAGTSSYACSCNSGYTGTGIGSGSCSDVNECANVTRPCGSDEACTNTVGSFTCTPCGTNAHYQGAAGAETCLCDTGYGGDPYTACGDLNECALGTDNCHANATCSNTVGSFTCACDTGYTGNGTTTCNDVDECADGSLNDCDHPASTCTNTTGSYTCGCGAGYTGTGIGAGGCADVDECVLDTDNCSADASCANTVGSFTCTCNAGYAGSGVTCTDVDECSTGAPCDPGSVLTGETCTNTLGSYTCSCPSGYAFSNGTCEVTNACNANLDDCDANATCTPVGLTMWTCSCNTGYAGSGQVCTDVNECVLGTDDCSTNATCTNTVGDFTCTCNGGYSGDGVTCTDVDECGLGTDNCHADATCANTAGSFTCTCNAGYGGNGVTCSNVDECLTGTDTCHILATCTDTVGSFTCTCPTGWTGNPYNQAIGCDLDINECANGTDDCDAPNATCINTPGSFACGCASGYTGDGRTSCTNVDECTLGTDNCSANAACTDTVGSFTCACNVGFSGNGVVCNDDNECLLGTDNCDDAQSTCTNTVGSFTCGCASGYQGTGVGIGSCTDIDECSDGTDDCNANATCTNTPGAFTCACNAGYVGNGVTACDDIDECVAGTDNCDPNATCTNSVGSFSCTCDLGYGGDGVTCADIDECADGSLNDCDDAVATCANLPGGFDCGCAPGYEGTGHGSGACTDVDECVAGTYSCPVANSSCTNTVGAYDCVCGAGYTGDGNVACTNVDECAAGTDDCDSIATCVDTDGAFDCSCPAGYPGDGHGEGNCADVDECALGTDDCNAPNSICTNTPGSFTCACDAGYAGDGRTFCDDVNECTDGTHDCTLPNSMCVNTTGAFDCACVSGYVGDGRTACDDVDECAAGTDNCNAANALCNNLPGTFSCGCDVGYVGDGVTTCTDVDECANGTHDCTASNAACTNVDGSFTCGCQPGFTGDGRIACDDVDECSTGTFTCGANRDCQNTVGSYDCVCTTGYTDDGAGACTDIDECALGTGTCPALQTCSNTIGGYDCLCVSGYVSDGSGGCTDVDECTDGTFSCGQYEVCSNNVGGYDCVCDQGWVDDGSGNCIDVDECADGTASCAPGSGCINTPGSYSCTCTTGYEWDGTDCVNVDECAQGTASCRLYATCVDNVGSYDCPCDAGFTDDGTNCNDIDECADGTDNCDPNATCTNQFGSFSCRCLAGFTGTGTTCADIDDCTPTACGTNEICVNQLGAPFTCACTPGTSRPTAGAACAVVCGDAMTHSTELCDDGNVANGDGCSAQCRIENGWSCYENPAGTRSQCSATCGNGFIDSGEQCDEGAQNSDAVGATCRTNCRLPGCGDGRLDSGEECDQGAQNSDTLPNTCRTSCRFAFCGDGVVDNSRGELCDPGGNVGLPSSVCEQAICDTTDGGGTVGPSQGCGCHAGGDGSPDSGKSIALFGIAALLLGRRRALQRR